jgi:hypothetical protein
MGISSSFWKWVGRFFISAPNGDFGLPDEKRQINTGLILSLLRLENMPPIKK